MKTLTARQAELAGRRTLKPIPLVVLTTYTDNSSVANRVVDAVHYFSDRPLRYDYGDTGTLQQFHPFIESLSPIVRSMPHLGNSRSFGLGVTDDLTLVLRNGEIDGSGETLWQSFQGVELIDANAVSSVPSDEFRLNSAGFDAAVDAGQTARIASGTGAGQSRRINEVVSGGSIVVGSGWVTLPIGPADSQYEIWRDERLEGATVTVAELLVDPESQFDDTDDLVGDEHLVFYRGDIEQVRDIGDTITISVKQADLPMNFYPLDGAKPVDPIDRGHFANYVYGDIKAVPCQGVVVGAVGLSAFPIDDAATIIGVENIDQWPDSGGGWIGLELISWSSRDVDNGLLLGVLRGLEFTTALQHSGGALVAEAINESLFAVAVHPMATVDDFYALNPIDGRLLRLIPGTHGNINISDSRPEVPFDWCSISITSTQMTSLKLYFEAQSDFEDPAQAPDIIDQDFFVGLQTQNDMRPYDSNLSNFFGGVFDGVVTDLILRGDAGQTPFDKPAITASISGLPGGAQDRIEQWRVKVTVQVDSPQSIGRNMEARFRLYHAPVNSEQPPFDDTLPEMTVTAPQWPTDEGDGPGVNIKTVVSRWFNAVGDLRLDAFNGSQVDPWDQGDFFLAAFRRYTSESFFGDDDPTGLIQIALVDVILESKESFAAGVSRTRDANTLTRISSGQGLRLFVDGTGYTAPDTDYTADMGDPIRNPPDIVRHMIVERAQLPASTIDDGPGSTWEHAIAELVFKQTAFVTSDYAETWTGEMGQYSFENRIQIIAEEDNAGFKFKMLVAEKQRDDLFVWIRSGRSISEWQSAVEDTRELESIYTRWRWFSEPNRALINQGFRDPSATFPRAITVDQIDPTDLSAIEFDEMQRVEKIVGARDSPPRFLVSPRPTTAELPGDNAWADEVAEYYISESKRLPASVVALDGVPWVQGYDLELGDVIDVQLDHWPDEKSVRLLGYSKNWRTGLIDLVGIEVNAK